MNRNDSESTESTERSTDEVISTDDTPSLHPTMTPQRTWTDKATGHTFKFHAPTLADRNSIFQEAMLLMPLLPVTQSVPAAQAALYSYAPYGVMARLQVLLDEAPRLFGQKRGNGFRIEPSVFDDHDLEAVIVRLDAAILEFVETFRGSRSGSAVATDGNSGRSHDLGNRKTEG